MPGYPCHPGFALEPSILKLSSGLVEEPPIERKGGKFRGDGRDVRDASGSSGREPCTREVKTPIGSEEEETSPYGIVLCIYAPYSGHRETGDNGVQIEETEDVNREFRGKSCDDVYRSYGVVDVDETGLVID